MRAGPGVHTGAASLNRGYRRGAAPLASRLSPVRRILLAVAALAVVAAAAGAGYGAGWVAGGRGAAHQEAAYAAQAASAHNEAELAAAAAAAAAQAARSGTAGICWTASGGRVTGLAPPVAQPGGFTCPAGPWRWTPVTPQPAPSGGTGLLGG